MTAPRHFACMNSATGCRDVEIQARQSQARACSWWCHAHPLLPDLQYLLFANWSWNFCKEEIQVKGPFIVGTWACGFQERRTTYASLSLCPFQSLLQKIHVTWSRLGFFGISQLRRVLWYCRLQTFKTRELLNICQQLFFRKNLSNYGPYSFFRFFLHSFSVKLGFDD